MLSIVIPVYNNLGQLPELFRRLQGTLSGHPGGYEILFVEDCGEDGSLNFLEQLCRQHSNVGLIGLGANVGQHRATLTGLDAASGGVLVVMDADLQDRPEDIPAMLDQLKTCGGAVFARRSGRYQSLPRQVSSRLFGLVLRALLGGRIIVASGPFVALEAAVFAQVRPYAAEFPNLRFLIAKTSCPISSVNVQRDYRPGGESGYSMGKRVRTGLRVLRMALTATWLYRQATRNAAPLQFAPIVCRAGTAADPLQTKQVTESDQPA